MPLKRPVPPRTCVFWSLATSQLMPTRGDHSTFVSGIRPVWNCTGLPFSSRNVSASAAGFWNAVFLNLATSKRTPAVTVRLPRGRHSSCA